MSAKAWVMKTIRLTQHERSIIDGACEAFYGCRSILMSEAVVDAAHAMGIYAGSSEPGSLREPWPHVPDRTGSTTTRICVSLSLRADEMLSRAAARAKTTEPQFMVGATLAYIARLEAQRHASNQTMREGGPHAVVGT